MRSTCREGGANKFATHARNAWRILEYASTGLDRRILVPLRPDSSTLRDVSRLIALAADNASSLQSCRVMSH